MIGNSPTGLNLLSLFQDLGEHPKSISLCAKKWTPFPMSQAKVAKRSKFLDKFVMRESKHESPWHILDPDELEIPRVIIDMEVA